MKVYCVIPARLESSRLERKMLLDGPTGNPLIYYPWLQATKCRVIDEVIVATDSDAIYNVVSDFGGRAIMTSSGHASGTDRVYDAVTQFDNLYNDLPLTDDTVIINLQGDEVDLRACDLSRLVEVRSSTTHDIATLAIPFADFHNYLLPENVKVVFTKDDMALYFSRGCIPFRTPKQFNARPNDTYKHIGVYAYTWRSLSAYRKLGRPSALEYLEKLEQLRAIENGMTIRVGLLARPSNVKGDWPCSINTQRDYEKWVKDGVSAC